MLNRALACHVVGSLGLVEHSIALLSELMAFVDRVDSLEQQRSRLPGAPARLNRTEIAEALAEALGRRADLLAVQDTPAAPARPRAHDAAMARRAAGMAARIAGRLGVTRRDLHQLVQARGRRMTAYPERP